MKSQLIGVKGRRGLVSPKEGKSDSPKKRQRSFSPRKGRVLAVMMEDAYIVKENPVSVNKKKLAAVVKDHLSNVPVAKADVVKSSVDKEALVDKASVLSVTKTNVLTQLEIAPDVVNDKVSKESVLSTGNVDVVQDDPAKVVIQSVLTQLENAPDVENSAPDVGKNKNVVADKVDVAKDVVQDILAKVVKESVAKDKPKGSASSVVMNKDNREGVNDKALFQKDKALNVVSKTSQSLRLLIWEEGKMEGWYGILIQFLLMKKRSEIKRNLIEQKNVKGWFEEKTSILVGGHSLFNLVERETGDEFVKKWAAQFSPKELKQIRVNDNAWIIDSTNFESVPVVRTRPAIKSWTSYLMKQRQELELKKRVVGLLPINSDWTKAEMEEAEGFIVSAENSEKEIQMESHEIQMESHEIQVESHEIPLKSQEIQSHESHEIIESHEIESESHEIHYESHKSKIQDFFKKAEEKLSLICTERVMLEEYMRKAHPISFEDDGNGNNVEDDDDGNEDDDANDGDGNVDENDANECDKNPNGSNQTEEAENTVENYVIMSSPEEFTQWLNKNVNLVGETCDSIVAEYLHGDLFGDNSAAREASNEVVIPQIQPTQKRVVKPSSYVLSPYMNKKTNVVPKITKMEFIVGNSLFAMQGDKLAFRDVDSKSRALFPNVVITESMLDGTFTSFDEKWKRFSDQVNAQFNGNEGGRGLEGIDLVFFPICNSQHFYVVVFSLTKTTTMTILDNSLGTYDSKYKDVCDLLLYGHPRYATVARVKHTILKLK
ncbi:hypothetical protein Tco_0292291 [Tanacetum coccineum]